MVEYSPAQLDSLFHALSDHTRRRMLRSLGGLGGQARSVGELAAPFQISLAAASKHIKVLERAGLVTRTVQGRTHLCRLQPEALAAGRDWLRFYERFWNERLDALAEALGESPASTPAPSPSPRRKKTP